MVLMSYWRSKSEELKSKAEQQQRQRLREKQEQTVQAKTINSTRRRQKKGKGDVGSQHQQESFDAHEGWSTNYANRDSSRKHERGKDTGMAAQRSKRKPEKQQTTILWTRKQQQELLEAQLAQLEIDSQPTTDSNSSFNSDETCECEHGLASYDYDDYVSVHDFVKDFVEAYNHSISERNSLGESFIAAYRVSKEQYAHLWKDTETLGMVVSYLSAWGTNHLLNADHWNACSFAMFANVFQQYAAILLKSQSTIDWKLIKELNEADEDTLTSFFRGHIPCSCLDGSKKKIKCSELMVEPVDETSSICSELEAEEEKVITLLEGMEEECRVELGTMMSADEEPSELLVDDDENFNAIWDDDDDDVECTMTSDEEHGDLLEAEEEECTEEESLASMRSEEDENQPSICDLLEAANSIRKGEDSIEEQQRMKKYDEALEGVCRLLVEVGGKKYSVEEQRRVTKYEDALADVCRILVEVVGKKST